MNKSWKSYNTGAFNDELITPAGKPRVAARLAVNLRMPGFAHLQIGCLRSVGVPAKYVSGYIETLPKSGEKKLVGADATHAWIACFSSDEGWIEFDTTNNTAANSQHIVTTFGREYFDVTPVKGVIFGGGEAPILEVSVDVARS